MRLLDFGVVATDFLEALEQVERAGFSYVDEGHHACLYANPAYPDVLVRAGNSVDGFAAYGVLSRTNLAPYVGVHVPRVHDIVVTKDDCCICLVERLEPVPEDGPMADMAAAFRSLSADRMDDAAAVDDLRERYPQIEGFLADLRSATGRRHFDLREGNLMTRGGDLVLNDPLGGVLHVREVDALRASLPLSPLSNTPPVRDRWWEEPPLPVP